MVITAVWLALKNISNYQEVKNKVIVTFTNKKQLKLNISYDSFENQLLRATKLLLILQNRKKKHKITLKIDLISSIFALLTPIFVV